MFDLHQAPFDHPQVWAQPSRSTGTTPSTTASLKATTCRSAMLLGIKVSFKAGGDNTGGM